MKDCPSKKQNLAICPCSYPACERKGVCCECLHYHRKRAGLPACFFPPEIEKTYDRSIATFIKNVK